MVSTESQEPILASWTISEVLKRYPALLDTLVDLSPAFTKLRNPLMRRVQSRLVTVAQAAGIAGLDPAALTRQLNEAAGITAPSNAAGGTASPQTSSVATPDWAERAPVVSEIDARPLMARGEEPFKAIMATARPVPVGAAFRLRVGFEPLPLYDALAKQGFSYLPRRDAPDDWTILFYRERPAGTPPAAPKSQPAAELDWESASTAEVTIDVSELVPPEPMVKILRTLETLPPDARLLVHHVRRPIHLYDRLDEMGYPHQTRELVPGQVEVLIQKRVPAAQSS